MLYLNISKFETLRDYLDTILVYTVKIWVGIVAVLHSTINI